MPFPTALAGIVATRSGLEPWAIAANGFTSVIGSALALPLAMILGYKALLAIGCGLYLLAALAYPAAEPEAGAA
jgi:hypothetical protein